MTTGGNANRLELARPDDGSANVFASRGLAEELLHAVRTRWPLVIAAALVTAGIAWLLAGMQPNRYRASVVAAVTPNLEALPPGDQMRVVAELDQRTIIATVAALASTDITHDQAVAPSGGNFGIRAIALPNTNLFRIEVEGTDAARAAAIANRVPQLVGDQTRAIFKFYGVRTVSPAGASELIGPRVARAITAGVIVGLIVGVLLAWAAERARSRGRGVAAAA